MPLDVSALSNLSSGRGNRVYEGREFAITVWTMREGLWLQLSMKDPTICRSGNGYLAAPLPAWVELRAVLNKLLAGFKG